MKPQDLDMATWEELFDYILESKTNGQMKQSTEIYQELTEANRVQFMNYLIDMTEQGWMSPLDLTQTIKFYQYESKN
jgi:hypothetical protein